jgi:glycosyltransferase involved in cell wall biosynthesis
MVNQARLFIFPSTTEAMSMMLLEAASLQAPIICSDIPENRIVMQDNVLYFRSGDAVDLADQIQWALSRCVKDNLTWETIVKQYEEVYRACIR